MWLLSEFKLVQLVFDIITSSQLAPCPGSQNFLPPALIGQAMIAAPVLSLAKDAHIC